MTITNMIRQSVLTTHRVDALDSIPTQSWVQQCASALCSIHSRAGVASLVCNYDRLDDRLSVYSSGACLAETGGRDELARSALSLQDRCERFTKLGLQLPDHSVQSGLIAPLQALSPNWAQSPIARVITGVQLNFPILHVVPIKQTDNATLCLINIYAFAIDPQGTAPAEALALIDAIHAPLRIRATAALAEVNNPRAWLTDREQHVLELLIEGQSVRSIADQLGRSSHTVHDHVKNLHKKIGASSRGELIAKAIGHTADERRVHYPSPMAHAFPGDQQLSELKPERPVARPLQR